MAEQQIRLMLDDVTPEVRKRVQAAFRGEFGTNLAGLPTEDHEAALNFVTTSSTPTASPPTKPTKPPSIRALPVLIPAPAGGEHVVDRRGRRSATATAVRSSTCARLSAGTASSAARYLRPPLRLLGELARSWSAIRSGVMVTTG